MMFPFTCLLSEQFRRHVYLLALYKNYLCSLGHWGFRPHLIQTGLCKHIRRLEARKFGFRK